MTSATTPNGQGDKPEPKQVYINDVLVQLEDAFPGTNEADMPADALDDASLPDGHPIKG